MGLFIMRERVALVDGDLEVASRAGHGTTVRATVPLTTVVGR
jgi:signal transduction histidine kinase